MQRILMDTLIEWKNNPNPDRKPILLTGIRHCGKTYLMRDFGSRYYKDVAYFDFRNDSNLPDLFLSSNNAQAIIKNLSVYIEKDIRPEETLVIFDEVQHCPVALDCLKLFCDFAPQYHIIAAASYIDVALPQGFSLPFGKIEQYTMYPMNFYEFLLVESPMLALHLKESGFKGEAYKTFNRQLEDKFRDFRIIGGIPEVVECWNNTKSIESVVKLQTQIVRSIETDIAGMCNIHMLPKVLSVFNAIPAQLIKGNRKFMFSKVKKSWRGKDLDDAVYWLERAGLIYKIEHIEKPALPISSVVNPAHFKLYMCDTGLLHHTGGFPSSAILGRDSAYAEIRSAIAENYVCCELMSAYERKLYYWSAENPGKAEVEFIIHDDDLLIPVEVKAGSAGRARSLIQYKIRFNPKKSVLIGADTDKDNVLPLYAVWNMKQWIMCC